MSDPSGPRRTSTVVASVGRIATQLQDDLVERLPPDLLEHLPPSRQTRPRAGVVRRAIRREVSRLRDRRRLLAMVILMVIGGLAVAGLIARGEAAGADARAYWA